MDAYLDIKNLKVGFRGHGGVRQIVDIDELQIQRGHAYALVGESGSGKSVMAYAVQQLLTVPPAVISCDKVELNGISLMDKSQKEMESIRGRKIAMIFQDPMSTLNPVFTVGTQLENAIRRNHKLNKADAHRKAVELIETVQMPDPERTLKKYPHELSGGQRQRIIIAIALGCGADFLIADEPTRNLDVTIQAGILKLLSQLRKEQNLTVLFITNNLSLVPLICDEVGLLHRGQIVESGSVAEVVDHPMHPYTEALLQPLPVTDEEKELIKTAAADDNVVTQGCRYQNKCRLCTERCRTQDPEMFLVEGSHKVRCFQCQQGG